MSDPLYGDRPIDDLRMPHQPKAVEVYVVGAGVASGDELPGAMIVSIQRFWQALFAAAGSELRPERYGAALVRFP
jgi:hypothetical protein